MDGQTVVIEDYLQIRPEARERLKRAVATGQIQVGPWYTLPDQFLVSGESIVRNLERGISLGDRHGGAMRVGYLPDSFGHAAQMPQIYRQLGFKHAVVWRGVPSAIDRLAFEWEAPDSSRVLAAYMATSYGHGVDLPTEGPALAARLRTALKALQPFKPGADLLLMNGNDHVLPQAGLSRAVRAAGGALNGTEVKLSRLDEYLDRLPAEGWPAWKGELRASSRANILMGTLSVRVPDKQLYFEAGRWLERYAEPLTALSGLDARGFLDEAWTLVLQNAAHDTACGSGIDAVAEDARVRSRAALEIGQLVASRGLERLEDSSSNDENHPRGGPAVSVWNPSPFPRSDLIEVEVAESGWQGQELGEVQAPETPFKVTFAAEQIPSLLSTLDERKIAGEVITSVRFTREGRRVTVLVETAVTGAAADLDAARREAEVLAATPDVEIFEMTIKRAPTRRMLIESGVVEGFCLTYIRRGTQEVDPASGVEVGARTLSNDRVRLTVERGGLLAVDDLATGTRYGALHRLIDEGDAGDEYNFSPPPEQLAILRPAGEPIINSLETGPLRGKLELRTDYVIPVALDHGRRRRSEETVSLPLTLRISLEAGSPQLDFELELENQARDHRLRVHFPLPFEATHSAADTPFHVTRRKALPARREPGAPEWELPTYPMRTFVDAGDGRRGVALITHGLHEYELLTTPQPAVALTLLRSVGWLSRADLLYRTGHAGPALQTPGAQVLGRHEFRYSLRFHSGDWESAGIWRAAETSLLPLMVGRLGRVQNQRLVPGMIRLEPENIQVTACVPREYGYDLRILNASDRPSVASLRIEPRPTEVTRVTLGGSIQERLNPPPETFQIGLRQWEIATLRVAQPRAARRTVLT
jgi:hypothetical protein